MGGFSTLLIVTYAYICFSRTSTTARAAASAALECSPTDDLSSRSFGGVFNARLLSMQRRSTSELLRTL